jgi:cation diffusion facilitator family transporter
MPAKESRAAVYAAFAANAGIAVSKFIAFLITGASSMLAEAVHSAADSSNQILLIIGDKQSRRQPSRTHPFGYARAHFLYAFIVSIVLFSLGGVFALYEGIKKIEDPHMLTSPLVAYIVLATAILFEGLALRTALREARSFKPKDQSWWQFLKHTKSVNHVVLTLEDSAALLGLSFATIGITLSLLTDNPVWDGIATLCIGTLLIVVAIILFREIKSLLIGEAVDPATERQMREMILSVEAVDRVVDLKTLYVGPRELFVAMKVTVGAEDSASVVAQAIDEIEARLRREFPIARLIYVEPDIYKTKRQQQRDDKVVEQSIKDK